MGRQTEMDINKIYTRKGVELLERREKLVDDLCKRLNIHPIDFELLIQFIKRDVLDNEYDCEKYIK